MRNVNLKIIFAAFSLKQLHNIYKMFQYSRNCSSLFSIPQEYGGNTRVRRSIRARRPRKQNKKRKMAKKKTTNLLKDRQQKEKKKGIKDRETIGVVFIFPAGINRMEAG